MAGWLILPVPAFLTQSIFYPPSIVPEGKTITEASKELGFRGRQRAFAMLLPAIGAQVMAERAGVGLPQTTWQPLGLYA